MEHTILTPSEGATLGNLSVVCQLRKLWILTSWAGFAVHPILLNVLPQEHLQKMSLNLEQTSTWTQK